MATRSLGEVRVGDAMHAGLISCSADTPLRSIARMMATNRVHAILVRLDDGVDPRSQWGIVESGDVLRATASGDVGAISAATIMTSPVPAVDLDDDVALAAVRMIVHDLSHVLVVEPRSGRAVGMVSALDVARASAGFPEQHPPSGWRDRELTSQSA